MVGEEYEKKLEEILIEKDLPFLGNFFNSLSWRMMKYCYILEVNFF